MCWSPPKLLFKLILIGLLSGAGGCGKSSLVRLPEMDSGADLDTDSDADSDTDADTETDTETDTGTDTDTDFCWAYIEEQYDVPAPPDGVPATLGDLCAVPGNTAQSGKAATVLFEADPLDAYVAAGKILVEQEIADKIVGLPQVQVTQAFPEDLLNISVSNMTATSGGFSFDVEIPETIWLDPGGAEISVMVTFELLCDEPSGDTKMVESLTYLHYCDGEDHCIWVSSGGECIVCGEVCEKIASPLPALPGDGPLALSASPGTEIVPVAQYGRKLILFAEQRGAKDQLSYFWKATGGTLIGEDKAGVIWEVPRGPGSYLIQVAVRDNNSASVATMSWRHKA